MTAIYPDANLKHSAQPLKRKTWRFFLLVLSIFCVIFIASYSIIMIRAAVDNEVSDSEFAMTSISKNIKLCLDGYKQMSRQIMLNSDVTDFLLNTDGPLVYEKSKARDGIMSVLNTYSFVDSVYVFHLNGESVRTGAGIMNVNNNIISSPEWNEPLIEAKGASIVMINGNGAFAKDTGTPLITMARLIYDVNTQKVIGKLVVNLTPSLLYSSLKDLGRDRAVCFFDRDGNILWGDESLESSFKPESVRSGFNWETINSGGKRQILSVYSIEDMPIVQVSLSDVSGSGIQSWETIWLAITLLAAVVLAVLSSGAFISINIARPIDMLTEAIEDTKSNGMLHEIDLSLPNNEIRRLADSYNSMIVHINRLITELIEKEKSVQKAEMRTLHEQIKPHFLYNSLETISYMALQGGAPKVYDAF
jgi:two-component system sensor histidine kinase YesM